MPIQTLHLRSNVQGKEPVAGTAAGQLPVGSIGINFNKDEPFLTIQDSAGAIRRIAGIKVGAAAPATPTAGEAWLDTSVATKPVFKVHDGTAWQGAGSGVSTGAAAPAAPAAGDLWVDTTTATAPVLKVYNGTAFVAVTPDATDAVKGVVELATATETVDGVDTTRAVTPAGLKSALGAQAGSSTAPASPVVGQVWVDNSTSPSVVKVWGGTPAAWIPQVGGTVTGATAPTTPVAGTIWIDTSATPNVVKVWDGTAWVTAAPDGSAAAAIANDAKYATKAEMPWKRTGTNTVLANAGDRVGLGTSSPSQRLTLQNSGGVAASLSDGTTEFGLLGSENLITGSGNADTLMLSSANAKPLKLRAPSGQSISLNIASSNAVTIDSSSRVGIGTTSVSELLHLNGASAAIQVQDSGATNSIGKIINSGGILYIQSQNNTSHGQIVFRTSDGSATERARIDSSGRLLVGTSTARSNLFNTAGSAALQLEGTGTSRNIAVISDDGNAAGAASITLAKQRSGAVGGNTIVQSGDAVGYIYFEGSDGTEFVDCALIKAEIDGTPGADDMPGRLVFSTTADGAASPTERARITSNGFLKADNSGNYISATGGFHELRSTNSNTQAFQVSHGGTSGQQYGMYISTSNDQNDTTRWFLQCIGGVTERLTIRSNGGIANYSANNVNLSDRKVKKDIAPAADTWDCLKEWEIVNFRYKDQPDDADLNMGVIAQQVAESCPEVITIFQEAKEATEDQPAQEERLGVKDQQMMWMAIKALQEAQIRIETLEAEVAALKGA
jgi:hypothetical protein